jgi:hypothetical protein
MTVWVGVRASVEMTTWVELLGVGVELVDDVF